MLNRPTIDNRDLRILNHDVNENLSDIVNLLMQSKESNDHALEEINIHLSDIATSLRDIAKHYISQQ